MKTIILFGFFALAACGTDRFSNINVKEVVSNDRLLKIYVDCFLDVGKCGPDAREIKKNLPSTIRDMCADCTESDKYSSVTAMNAIKDRMPGHWEKFKAKYVTNEEQLAFLEEFLKQYSS